MSSVDRGIAFELAVLERMPPAFQAAVLQEVGISAARAAELRSSWPLKLLAQISQSADAYAELIGPPIKVSPPGVFAGSVASYFVLQLWPHLYWTVYTRPDGQSWDVGFENQAAVRMPIDPKLVRPGLWTRKTLDLVADHNTLHDGWDESVTVRFTFGTDVYEGELTFGLLHGWKRVPRLTAV